jgi:hypothetical protein
MRFGSRVALMFLLALQPLGWTQAGTTSVRGTVSDSSGAAVSGAKVTLSNPERGFERTATTGTAGGYEFLQTATGDLPAVCRDVRLQSI